MTNGRVTVTRGKPAVAYRSEVAARENLSKKLSILTDLIRSGAGLLRTAESLDTENFVRLRATAPKTIRQFNLWTHESLPEELRSIIPTFGKNSNETLRRHADIKSSVADAIAVLHKGLNVGSSKPDRLSHLRRKLSAANRLRIIAEKELISQKYRILKLQDEVVSLRAQVSEYRKTKLREPE